MQIIASLLAGLVFGLGLIVSGMADPAKVLESLEETHRFVYSKLSDEYLWSPSMPCTLPAEEDIPIAEYGSSNIGKLKHVYRKGLALRYGRTMQCIAGIHYNFSLPEALWPLLRSAEGGRESDRDYQSSAYIALIRNFRRYSWLLMYLFGASPALDKGFLRGRPHQLEDNVEKALHERSVTGDAWVRMFDEISSRLRFPVGNKMLVETEVFHMMLSRDPKARKSAAKAVEKVYGENISTFAFILNTIAKEKEIFSAQAAESGKPAEIIEKMVQGRIKKFLAEVTLLGQPFVKDPETTVAKLLDKAKARVVRFQRFEVGEGIEKAATDFAAEVMAQVRGS